MILLRSFANSIFVNNILLPWHTVKAMNIEESLYVMNLSQASAFENSLISQGMHVIFLLPLASDMLQPLAGFDLQMCLK